MKKNFGRARILGRSRAAAILLLSCGGGAVALVHQLLWARRMVDLMGGTAGATARVFGCFFLGLALGALAGAWLAGRCERGWRPWRILAGVEAGIALCCLPVLLLPWWSAPIWPWLGPQGLVGWEGALVKTLLSGLLVLPPAALMGIFVPLAVQGWKGRPAAAAGDGPPAAEPGLLVYACNTLGAVLGAGVLAPWLLLRFGLSGAICAAIAWNGLAALWCLLLDRPQRSNAPRPEVPTGDVRGWLAGMPPSRLLLAAGLSGFLVLAAEISFLPALQLVAPMSFFAPAALLAVVILLLAGGAFAVDWWRRKRGIDEACLPWIAAITGLALLVAPLVFHWLAPHFTEQLAQRESPALAFFLLKLALFTLLVIGPAMLAAGLWFPVVVSLAVPPGSTHAGIRWGWLLAVNGLGGLLGAEIAWTVLLPAVGPFGAPGVLAVGCLAVAWAVLPRPASVATESGRRRPRLPAKAAEPALLALCALAVAASVWVLPVLPTVNPVFLPMLQAQSHSREGSIAVIEGEPFGRAILVQNQYILGTSAGRFEQERQAHIPLLLHPNPERVAFIGVATGITPGGALAHAAVREIHAVEISSAVARAAAEWFNEYNRGVSGDERAHIVIEDGRTWLAAHRAAFDVVIADLFLPWAPGEARLFSTEHFRAARAALRPGGLFCQWLPLYQLTQDQFMVIAATMLEHFPRIDLFLRETNAGQPALALVGWENGGWSPETLRQRLEQEGANLGDPMLLDAGVAQALHVGTLQRGKIQAPLNTLDNLWVELDAGRLRLLHPATAPYLEGHRARRWIGDLRESLARD